VVDRNLLFQACANIVDNAIKYTPKDGHVQITLSQGDQYGFDHQLGEGGNQEASVTFSVIDSGCGIEQSNYKKVLRRFYREENSRSLQPGNGLGLSLVAAVAKLHDFQLIFRPNDPGLQVHLHMQG
jgi:signal transduction histidine kinase